MALRNKAKFGPQLTYDSSTGTGSYIAFSSTLSNEAAIIIFDNQSNVDVTISIDGSTDGITFDAGQAMVLDLRSNRMKLSDDMAFPKGTQFYATSSSGSGNFYISYIYAG